MSGLTQAQYQIVLTGELLPGIERESAINGMAKLFSATPDSLRELFDGTSHPIAQEFTAEQAHAVRARLEKIGVDSRVERRADHALNLKLNPDITGERSRGDDDYGVTVARSVAAGMGAKNSASPAVTANAAGRSGRPAPDPNNPHWNRGWDDFEDDESDEDRNLALFIGPGAPRFLRVFSRFGSPLRSRFALSWNWGAFVSPFLWTMYRKMWFWAFLISLTEVLVPMTIFFLDRKGVLIEAMAPVAYLIAILNRLFWPAVLDFLYFRHVHGSLARLHRMSPTSPHESEIAMAGGVSTMSSVIGVALASVLVLFTWSAIDSMGIETTALERGGYGLDDDHEVSRTDRFSAPPRASSTLPRLPQATSRPTNNWGKTRTQLRLLATQINDWLIDNQGGANPTVLTLFKLREQVGIAEDGLRDAWGADIQYIPGVEGYRLISSGPDQLFGTADDIQFKQVLGR